VADELDLSGYPWPRRGDDPFELVGGSRLVACLNFTHDEPWIGYVEGFKRLADVGVAHIEETGHGHDFLVYPIVYAYRHHIELSLKLIIRTARKLLDEPAGVPKTHNLLRLWDEAEPLLRRVGGPEETFRDVRECLIRFTRLDPSAESFRYPVRATGDVALPGVDNVDLGQVRAVVERLSMFLDCAAEEMLVRLDFKTETEQAYQASW
jgi:hypothetical protein